MEIKYEIRYLEGVIKDDIPNLSIKAKSLIIRSIDERLIIDPIRYGKPLRFTVKGYRRFRVSIYRIVYRVDTKLRVVTVVAIKKRSNVYDDNLALM